MESHRLFEGIIKGLFSGNFLRCTERASARQTACCCLFEDLGGSFNFVSIQIVFPQFKGT